MAVLAPNHTPLRLLILLYRISIWCPDPTKSLRVGSIKYNTGIPGATITGKITNKSSKVWTGVTIEAEFYTTKGEFLAEHTKYISSNIKANGWENFSMDIPSNMPTHIQPRVKIAAGRIKRF